MLRIFTIKIRDGQEERKEGEKGRNGEAEMGRNGEAEMGRNGEAEMGREEPKSSLLKAVHPILTIS
jgi:hypothetical protein